MIHSGATRGIYDPAGASKIKSRRAPRNDSRRELPADEWTARDDLPDKSFVKPRRSLISSEEYGVRATSGRDRLMKEQMFNCDLLMSFGRVCFMKFLVCFVL